MIEQVVFESPIYEINKLEDVLYPFGFSSGDLVPLKLEMIKVYVIDEMNLESRQLSVDEFTFSKDGVRLVDFVTLTESRIQIVLDMAIAQELDLKNQTVLSLSNTEKSLDKMTLMMLTLKRLVKQCVSAPVGVAVKGYEDFVAVYNLCKAEVVKASKQADRAKEQADIAKEQGDRAQEHVAQAMKDVVIDSLSSTDVTKPLSAKQGMVLNSYKAEKMNPNLDGHLISSLGSDGDVSALVGSETFQMRVSERNNGAQTFIFDREGPRFDLGALGGGKNLRVNNSPVLLAWDVMDNLESNLKSNPLSANQGCLLKGFIDVKADIATTYDKSEVDSKLESKADLGAMTTALNKKLDNINSGAPFGFSVDAYGVSRIKATENPILSGVVVIDISNEPLGRTIHFAFSAGGLTMDNVKALFRSDVVNNLLSSSSDTPLSANMGKALNEAKADKVNTYNKTQVDTKLETKADVATTYAKSEVDTKLEAKADVATTYAKSEVDSKLAGLTAGALIFKGTWNALTNVPVILTAPKKGEFWIVSDSGTTNVGNITEWQKNDWVVFVDPTWAKVDNTDTFTVTEKTKLAGIQEGAQVNTVTRVAGKIGDVVLVKADVGLSSVDNTSDMSKPVSTAVQMALSTKVEKIDPMLSGKIVSLEGGHCEISMSATDSDGIRMHVGSLDEGDHIFLVNYQGVSINGDPILTSSAVYNNNQVDTKLGLKADLTEVDTKLTTKAEKIDPMLSGKIVSLEGVVSNPGLTPIIGDHVSINATEDGITMRAFTTPVDRENSFEITRYRGVLVNGYRVLTKECIGSSLMSSSKDFVLSSSAGLELANMQSHSSVYRLSSKSKPVNNIPSNSSLPPLTLPASGASVEYSYSPSTTAAYILPKMVPDGSKRVFYLINPSSARVVTMPAGDYVWEINGVVSATNVMPDLSKANTTYVILYDCVSQAIMTSTLYPKVILSLICTIER